MNSPDDAVSALLDTGTASRPWYRRPATAIALLLLAMQMSAGEQGWFTA